MKVNVWRRKEGHGPIANGHRVMECLAEGIRICGHKAIEIDPQYEYSSSKVHAADINITFGIADFSYPQIVTLCKQNDKPFLVGERGFFHRWEPGIDWENKYWSFGWRGNCGNADYRNNKMPPDRWNQLGLEIKPYKMDGNILICGDWPEVDWPVKVVAEIRKHTKRNIIIRHHPSRAMKVHVPGAFSSYRSREEDLEDAFIVLVHNSSICFEALLNGCHLFQWDSGLCGAHKYAEKDVSKIDDPLECDREQLFYNLAYAQWNCDELRSGEAWKHLNGESEQKHFQIDETLSADNTSNFKQETVEENWKTKSIFSGLNAIPNKKNIHLSENSENRRSGNGGDAETAVSAGVIQQPEAIITGE